MMSTTYLSSILHCMVSTDSAFFTLWYSDQFNSSLLYENLNQTWSKQTSFVSPTLKQSTRTCLKCLVSGHFCLNSIKFHYTQRKPCKIMLLTVLICLAGFVFILFLLFLVAIRRAHSLLKLCLDNICIFYKFNRARKCLVGIMFSMIAFK